MPSPFLFSLCPLVVISLKENVLQKWFHVQSLHYPYSHLLLEEFFCDANKYPFQFLQFLGECVKQAGTSLPALSLLCLQK